MGRSRRIALSRQTVLGLVGSIGLVVASRASAQDFFEQRLRAAKTELSARQPAEALVDLKLASFGFLGRPALLCEALSYRALAEEATGKSADATATLVRMVQIARAFPTCREAEMEPARREEFAAVVRRRLGTSDAEAILSPPAPRPQAAAPVNAAPLGATSAVTAQPTPVSNPVPTAATPRPAEPAAAPAGDLDRQPQLLSTTRPIYPPAALQARVGGIVLLRVLVSARGAVSRVEVARGVQADLDQAAIAAVRLWRFEPAQKAGAAVEAWMTIAVPFDPSR